MNATKNGPGVFLSDESGKTRAMLVAHDNGSMLALLDENGMSRIGLAVFKLGPGLNLRDENGKNRAMLVAHKDGPVLALLDENGKGIWQAP